MVDKIDKTFCPEKGNSVNSFFKFIVDKKLSEKTNIFSLSEKISEFLAKFEIKELLCLIVLFDICHSDLRQENKKIFYILDNLDVMYDDSDVEDYLRAYSLFIMNMGEFMEKLSELNILNRKFNLYDDIKFCFFMRETSATILSDHCYEKLMDCTSHFDISSDINKCDVAIKKCLFVEKYKDQIHNYVLKDEINKVKAVVSDNFIKKNIVSLFNNDFKRFNICLREICKETEQIEEFLFLSKSDYSYNRHGGRGILFRLVFDHFKKIGYLNKIGISTRQQISNAFTPARSVLTFLVNKQKTHNKKYLFETFDEVTLNEIIDSFKHVITENVNTAKDEIITLLWDMYSLRKSQSWNHLITFDSIKTVNKEMLKASKSLYNHPCKCQ